MNFVKELEWRGMINNTIEKDYKLFAKNIGNLYDYAEHSVMDATFYWKAKSKVTYNKNNIISIRVMRCRHGRCRWSWRQQYEYKTGKINE